MDSTTLPQFLKGGSNRPVFATNISSERLEKSPERSDSSRASHQYKFKLPKSFWKWIPANWTWSKIKPVIRCAVAAWIAAILFIIPRVQIFMGRVRRFILSTSNHHPNLCGSQASFLIIIGMFSSFMLIRCLPQN